MTKREGGGKEFEIEKKNEEKDEKKEKYVKNKRKLNEIMFRRRRWTRRRITETEEEKGTEEGIGRECKQKLKRKK
jgi:hypothetical protein